MESIKASELRIGNWVYGVSERIEQVIGFARGKVYTEKNNLPFETSPEDLSGIPLTPEILLKAGFEFSEDGTFAYQQDYLYIDIIRGKYVYMHPYHPLKLKYLHQLQNLYWCLCNKELDINLQ